MFILSLTFFFLQMSAVTLPGSERKGLIIAQLFFQNTLNSSATMGDYKAMRITDAFIAIAGFGNIVVMTYTAARVKQEIAKEGILPFPKFFAQNLDFSFGRFLRWAQRKPAAPRFFRRLLKSPWFAPEHHSEKTPVGALILHFASCVILILATLDMEPNDTYVLLSTVYAYSVQAFFGALLAAGILYLRFSKKEDWRRKAETINPLLSVTAAFIYLIGNLFPIIAIWIKPQEEFRLLTEKRAPWHLIPTLGWCVLGLGALWWLGFLGMAKRIEKRDGTIFTIQREPSFERDPPTTGPPVQVHETVYLAWVAKENLPDM